MQHVNARLAQAAEAFEGWRATSLADRALLLHALGATLRAKSADLSLLMTREMGKPITAAEAEIEKCAECCEYFALHGEEFLEPKAVESDAATAYVRFDPLGAVLAIMPWNFPFWQVFRFAAPALLAGNVGVLKHAPNVPGCSLAIERLFVSAGFPAGVFTSLLIENEAAAAVIEHSAIAAVTLTGSERAGSAVGALAGRALKKTVLELGGSDPFIVLPDADLPAVAKQAALARTINAGQSCIAAKRFIVVGPSRPFEQLFARELTNLKVGNPLERATQVGPLARLDLLENLQRQVTQSVGKGARVVVGGHRLPTRGYFYAPTLLADAKPGMAVFDEETFGPVAALIVARDIDEAITLANRSAYGLGASVWTRDTAMAARIAEQLDAGMVFINGIVKSDPRLPFGGIKRSGYGRELSSFGIREFVNIKTVWMGNALSTTETPRH